MTSTYPLPLFFPLTVPPFLACGAPIKSSILLTPLIAVAGLDDGADGGPEAEGVLPGTSKPPPTFAPASSNTAGNSRIVSVTAPGVLGDSPRWISGLTFLLGAADGGRLVGRGGGLEEVGGPPAALWALLGGPLGGGGVGVETVGASAPAFLLTHFLRVSS